MVVKNTGSIYAGSVTGAPHGSIRICFVSLLIFLSTSFNDISLNEVDKNKLVLNSASAMIIDIERKQDFIFSFTNEMKWK